MIKYVIIKVTVKESEEDDFYEMMDSSSLWHETSTDRRFELED